MAAPLEEPTAVEPAEVGSTEEDSAEEEAAVEEPAALELSLEVAVAVEVGVALVSAGVELEELAPVEEALVALVVSTGGTEMETPAEEHWATTALETADWVSWWAVGGRK